MGFAWKAMWGLCTGARLHQPQAQHIQSRKKRDDKEDAIGLSVDKPNQCVRARQKLRLEAVGFVAEISQNPTPERRSGNRNETEKAEIHSNDPCRNRDQMANHRKKPREKNSARLVASEPLLGLLQFFGSHQYKTAILYDQRTSN